MKWAALSIMVMMLAVTGCIRLTDGEGNVVTLNEGQTLSLAGMKVIEHGPSQLKALVKGSIYSSGEFVSVFGTCLNDQDAGFPGSSAFMSSWYPNGTLLFSNISMQEIQTGYFVYTGNMNAVQGTYLTEMECRVNGSSEVAKAFGEWQNPMWVTRITEINASTAVLQQQVQNLSQDITYQIGNLTVNMSDSFEITWDKIDAIDANITSSFTSLNQTLYYVASVANASVDRNDSYLAGMLQLLASTVGAPVSGNLTVNTSYSPNPPQYFKTITFTTEVRNEYGNQVTEPLVSCFISTSNDPVTSNVRMSTVGSGLFKYSEKVQTPNPLSYNVTCVYN